MAEKGAKKPRVSYTAPGDPPFLRRIKQQLGYKAPDTVDRKRDAIRKYEDAHGDDERDRDDLHGREEDRPVIVQLKDGDLDEQQVDDIVKRDNLVQEEKLIADGKITYRRPGTKRANEESVEKSREEKEVEIADKKKALLSKPVLESNARLLSFQDDDADDDEDADD